MQYESSLEDWYERYSQDVFNFLVYYNKTEDVDDLLQEVFIKAWKKEFSFRQNSSPKTWLFSIARRVSIDRFRKQKVTKWFQIQDHMQQAELTPEQTLLHKEEFVYLYEAIDLLKRSYREVIVCRGILELSTKETAEVLQCSTSKVDTTYYRAKAKLRSILEDQGRGINHAESR